MPTKNLLHSRLIVVDGLPGSGKSTTGQWLTSQLKERGLHTYWLPDTEIFHPLWWYNHWNGTDYQRPDFENIPIEVFIQTSLRKWKDFTNIMQTAGQRYVAESVFFQNAVAMFLMGGGKRELLVEYAHDVQKITQNLDPILIHFRQNNTAAALRKICTLRGRDFEEELIHNMEQFPYLKQRQLKGLDGVAVLWQDIRALTDGLFDRFKIRKLALDTSEENWSSYHQQILDFLGLR